MALKYKDWCVSKHSYFTNNFWHTFDGHKDYISHDDGTYTYFYYDKYEYRYRYDPVPRTGRSHWHRKGPNNYLRYKHFIDLSITDTHPLSYDNENMGDISFKKSKFKGYFWDVAFMKDYDQNVDDLRTHMSWKNNKSKKKQWM